MNHQVRLRVECLSSSLHFKPPLPCVKGGEDVNTWTQFASLSSGTAHCWLVFHLCFFGRPFLDVFLAAFIGNACVLWCCWKWKLPSVCWTQSPQGPCCFQLLQLPRTISRHQRKYQVLSSSQPPVVPSAVSYSLTGNQAAKNTGQAFWGQSLEDQVAAAQKAAWPTDTKAITRPPCQGKWSALFQNIHGNKVQKNLTAKFKKVGLFLSSYFIPPAGTGVHSRDVWNTCSW